MLLMGIGILLTYTEGIWIEKYNDTKKGKVLTVVSVIVSLSILGYFKYADFFLQSFSRATGIQIPLLKIALPIGISFYTFQMISYILDVNRKTVRAQRSLIDLATYIAMFPQLIAGPIVRYADIEPRLKERELSFSRAADGMLLFTVGLGKKVLIANALGEFCDRFAASEKGLVYVWVYALAVAMQIYYDFSGYSDMAIGLGRVLGFDFSKNFDYPFISKSVTEFWRRWHISLGSWFRDYLYIPLGGNRVSPMRHILNITVVWLATGLWHGAAWNFVIWGAFFAVFLILEKKFYYKWLNERKVINHIYLIFLTVVSFLVFHADTMAQGMREIGMLFGYGCHGLLAGANAYELRNYAVILFIALLGATPLAANTVAKIRQKDTGAIVLSICKPLFILAVWLLATASLVNGSYNPFLYFRF